MGGMFHNLEHHSGGEEHEPRPYPANTRDVSSIVVASLPRSTKIAREFTGSAFLRWTFDPPVVDTARTVTSELVTNAYRHGSPEGGDIVVRVYLSDAGPVIEVWDTSPAPPVRQPFDLTAECGRGLLLLDLMVKSWGHQPLAHGGKAVYAILDAGPV